MLNIAFRDLFSYFGTAKNVRQDGCVLADINETAILKLAEQPFRIDAYCLILCTEGECVVNIREKEHQITSGDLFLAIPTMYRITMCHNHKFSAKGLFLCTSYLNQYMLPVLCSISLFTHIMQHPIYKMGAEQYIQVSSIMQNIHWMACNSEHSRFNDEAIRNGVAMLLYIIGDYLQRIMSIQGTKNSMLNRREEYCFRFIDLLIKCPKASLRINYYAEQLCLTTKYLSALILETTGKTAKNWIDDFVIFEARFLLHYSDMSIQQIAFELDFPNQSFFGKFFKKHTGYSPRNFRLYYYK